MTNHRISNAKQSRRARQRAESLSKRAYSLAEFCEIYGIGRTRAYEELARQRLRGRKAGRRTIIAHEDAEDWLRSLPTSNGASDAA